VFHMRWVITTVAYSNLKTEAAFSSEILTRVYKGKRHHITEKVHDFGTLNIIQMPIGLCLQV
jgi:hypothetical protein